MSAVAGGRSIAYSADTAGRAGRIACQVVRSDAVEDGRVAYSIALRNDTDSDAQVIAFVPDEGDLRHRTVMQSVIGAYSHFATAVELELERYGGIPELHLQLSGADIGFALIVPNAQAALEAGETGAPKVAIAGLARANGSGLRARPLEPRETVSARAHIRTLSTNQSYAPHQPHEQRGAREIVPKHDAQKSPAAFPMLAAFTAMMAVVGIFVFRPQIRELAVPARARAATSVPIAYQVTGIGSVAYNVVGADAEPLAGGPLAMGSGTFTITLPRNPADRAYLVRVRISGIFGNAVAENYVKVSASSLRAAAAVAKPRPMPPPLIRSLALDRSTLIGGDKLNVYYDVAATSGTIALLDGASQIAYGTSDLSPSGHTAFIAPVVQSERSLGVVLTARRGTATTQSRVAVTVQPQSSPTPQADGNGFGSPSDDPASASTVAPIVVAAKTVRSAQPIRVDVSNGVLGLVLALTDDAGNEIARLAIRSSHSRTVFMAPAVTVPTRLRLQATYPEGSGSETIVRSIDVTPR